VEVLAARFFRSRGVKLPSFVEPPRMEVDVLPLAIRRHLAMTVFLIGVLVLALFACAVSLAREIRVRRALENLLQLLISRWRKHAAKKDNVDSVHIASADDHGDRLR
jgi:hypothetical protein